jgi:hypothetical protein
MVAAVDTLPSGAVVRQGAPVLAWGEATGHSHRIQDPNAATFFSTGGGNADGGYFVVSAESVQLIHEEHGPITLPRGTYLFWHQREYTPGAIRRVVD